ncbi:MAG: PEP-CTERM sorting domain-containing protein [Pyrinomonadaceae bacterium]|nr:PEP-CTERM sorting domain-containing protein [Pyrinomonadaceae bacterium]MCX7639287.1 PEP-CTERM sorting domain-containing protein [Pyrinomonadaceae bacterium]MDW8303491.1 PEP-CTERM sorting domain-containing protein [Acidobacteriota bacterium]
MSKVKKNLILLVTLIFIGLDTISAAPIGLDRVQRVIDLRPSSGSYVKLRLTDPPKDKSQSGENAQTTQDERVIVETTTSIVEDEACECPVVIPAAGGFPWWTLLGLGAVPFVPLITSEETPIVTPTPTTTPTPTVTPTLTPTPTVTPTPTRPPTKTPTPKEPIPEPIAVLLFGTGLAGIGIIARKRFSRSRREEK